MRNYKLAIVGATGVVRKNISKGIGGKEVTYFRICSFCF